MAIRKPLILNGGKYEEIKAPDTIDSTVLENVVAAATVGDATHIPVITYDAHGRITGTTTAAISSGTQRSFAFFMG